MDVETFDLKDIKTHNLNIKIQLKTYSLIYKYENIRLYALRMYSHL
jgi:hypothetical protein